jgi:biopolymer transport protein ExbB
MRDLLEQQGSRWRMRHWVLAAAIALMIGQAIAAESGPGQTNSPSPSSAAQESGSFLQLLAKGGWFMLPIGLASLMGLALVIERLVAVRRWRVIPPGFAAGLKRASPEGADDREAALRYCEEHPSPISRVVAAGLRKMPRGQAAVEKALEDAGGIEIQKLRRNLRMMYGVSVVAPMMGLLGTVWGMIGAFRVTSSARGLGRPEMLAKGIYEALVATLAGLMVAIPVLVFYYYLVSKIERIVGEMNEISIAFMDHFLETDKEFINHGEHGDH